MRHREVYGLLHDVLTKEARDGFVFADLGCGTAACSSAALAGTGIGRYVGIDISEPSLEVARRALNSLSCPVELRRESFPEAIASWSGPLDIVWIGQSLHHLHAADKRSFMRHVRRFLPADGLFLIWETTCLEGEDREGWMERFRQSATPLASGNGRGIRSVRQPPSRFRLSPRRPTLGKGWLTTRGLRGRRSFSGGCPTTLRACFNSGPSYRRKP